MRVHCVVVHPIAVVVALEVDLPGRDHRVLIDAIDVIFVDRQRVGERIVLLHLLKLLECRRDDLRVEQSDLRRGLRVLLQGTRLRLRGGLVLVGLHCIQPIGSTGRIDVALNVCRFHLLCIRIHAEPLEQHRP